MEKRQTHRSDWEPTALGRIAAMAEHIAIECLNNFGHHACFADYRDGLRVILARELLRAQKIEAQRCSCPERALQIEKEIENMK